MTLSSRTLALLAKPFNRGGGPSHSTISLIWASADADDYVDSEEDASKLNRVLGGLRALQRGREVKPGKPALPPDEAKLGQVVADLATQLIINEDVDADELDEAFRRDGFELDDQELRPTRPPNEPADRLAQHVDSLFGTRSDLAIARNHLEQGNSNFDRGAWEAANAQFRSACDATFDALAYSHGCPSSKSGGNARKWLEAKGILETDEAALVKSFMAFAGRSGSHAGTSNAADCQLRRHMASAVIAAAIAKFN